MYTHTPHTHSCSTPKKLSGHLKLVFIKKTKNADGNFCNGLEELVMTFDPKHL